MRIMAILVDEIPKEPEECPFCYGTKYDVDCCMGGRCRLTFGRKCSRLTAPFTTGEDDDDEEEDWYD